MEFNILLKTERGKNQGFLEDWVNPGNILNDCIMIDKEGKGKAVSTHTGIYALCEKKWDPREDYDPSWGHAERTTTTETY